MTIRSAPYYWVKCDGCGVSSTEGGEYSAWNGESVALDDALNSDWTAYGDLHFCYDCTPKDDDGGAQESPPFPDHTEDGARS